MNSFLETLGQVTPYVLIVLVWYRLINRFYRLTCSYETRNWITVNGKVLEYNFGQSSVTGVRVNTTYAYEIHGQMHKSTLLTFSQINLFYFLFGKPDFKRSSTEVYVNPKRHTEAVLYQGIPVFQVLDSLYNAALCAAVSYFLVTYYFLPRFI